ncbi:MAG: glycosyltransferase [Pseudooceanicola nanhaiensis]
MSRDPTILLTTCNGAAHLAGQLDSFAAQSETGWSLWASDDGSTDATRAILEDFRAARAGRNEVRIIDGPRRGAAANFLSLLTHPELLPGPVALSDQDDVWLPGKLARAMAALEEAPADRPVIYGAQSHHVTETLERLGPSRPWRRPGRFENALLQNIVSGHSCVLNAAALELVRAAGPVATRHHDWWLYQLVSGAGGIVHIDPEPVLLYRQHGANVMGAHRGTGAKLARMAKLFGREYGRWIAEQTAALDTARDLLTPANRATLDAFRARLGQGPACALAMARAGLHRQTRATTAAVYAAAVLGRL